MLKCRILDFLDLPMATHSWIQVVVWRVQSPHTALSHLAMPHEDSSAGPAGPCVGDTEGLIENTCPLLLPAKSQGLQHPHPRAPGQATPSWGPPQDSAPTFLGMDLEQETPSSPSRQTPTFLPGLTAHRSPSATSSPVGLVQVPSHHTILCCREVL